MDKNHRLNEAKWAILFISIVLLAILIVHNLTRKNMTRIEKILVVNFIKAEYADQIIDLTDSLVKPLIYDCQVDCSEIPNDYKKLKFFSMVIPAILVTKYELKKDHIRTVRISQRLKNNQVLPPRDSLFLGLQMVKYQTTQVSEILRKQQVHPTSIILAQAILESGWGTSRFFREGNNLFGLWSYNPGEDRMTTRDNREGKSVHLKKYSTLKECIEDYFVTIANSWAYEEFRKKRLEVENPFELIWYLQRYSELRYEYVKKVGEIMIQNDLKKYDHYVIDPVAFTEIQLK